MQPPKTMTVPSLLLLFLAPLCARAHAAAVDSVSMVQGRVQAHQHINFTDRACAMAQFEMSERLALHVAMKSQLVVIRGSGEDLRWLDQLPEVPAIVYNRNGLDELLPKHRENLNIISEENEGGQEGCMLNHIIQNYEQLAEYTLFLQGWPFWHCGAAVQEVRRALENIAEPTDPVVVGNGGQQGLIPLAASFWEYSLEGGRVGFWHDLALANIPKKSRENVTRQATQLYKDACTKALGEPCPETMWVAEGAQWAVSSSRIRSRPKTFYEKLQQMSYTGSDDKMNKLRGLVMEAVWPTVWGSPDWQPELVLKKTYPKKSAVELAAKTRADAYGDYCAFTSEPKVTGTSKSRRSMCELDQHEGSVAVIAGQSWKSEARLRAIPNMRITADMVSGQGHGETGETSELEPFKPACQKRHIWPLTTMSRAKNKHTGQCIQYFANTRTFAINDCSKDMEAQRLKLVSNENGGNHQIQDYTESSCLYHNVSVGSGAPCKRKPGASAIENQRWELYNRGTDGYQIRATDANGCLQQVDQRILVGHCSGQPNTLWDFPDLKQSPAWVEAYEYFITRSKKGAALAGSCATRLHSDDPKASLDLVQPDWKKRGQILSSFTMVDGPNNSYYLMDPGTEHFMGCDRKTREVVFGTAKMPWKVQRLGGSLVYLKANRQTVLQLDNGVLKCGYLPEDGVPTGSSTFILEF